MIAATRCLPTYQMCGHTASVFVMQTDEPFGNEPVVEIDPDPLLPPELLDAHDGRSDDTAAPGDVSSVSARIPHRYRGSMGASMLAASMIAMRDILESPKDDRPVVEQHLDEGDIERRVTVVLDPDNPSASSVQIRRDS